MISLRIPIPLLFALAFAFVAADAVAGDQTRNPEKLDLRKLFRDGIPKSPSIQAIYAYADALLAHGRDEFGTKHSGLFLSALDRNTLGRLERRPPAPAGLREDGRPGRLDGPLVGASPSLDENLLRFLYFLPGLSGKKRYSEAADQELLFLLSTAFEDQELPPWRSSLFWDTVADEIVRPGAKSLSSSRPWLLWDRCFELAPEASLRFAHGLRRQPVDEEDLALAGYCLRAWAEAFHRSGDELFARAIESTVERQERLFDRGKDAVAALSLAIDADGAARKAPAYLRERLRGLASRIDAAFLALPHDLKHRHGFQTVLGGEPGGEPGGGTRHTDLWKTVDGATTAAVAVLCSSRYENTGKTGYRDLLVAAADVYRESLPSEDADTWPLVFGHAITLEIAAYRATSRAEYFRRAYDLGELAVETFFAGSPLPRASTKSEHYESGTGADTLVLALVDLHLLTLQITAVRAPVNTIDR